MQRKLKIINLLSNKNTTAIINGTERDFPHTNMVRTIVIVPQQPNNTDTGMFVMYSETFHEISFIHFIIKNKYATNKSKLLFVSTFQYYI